MFIIQNFSLIFPIDLTKTKSILKNNYNCVFPNFLCISKDIVTWVKFFPSTGIKVLPSVWMIVWVLPFPHLSQSVLGQNICVYVYVSCMCDECGGEAKSRSSSQMLFWMGSDLPLICSLSILHFAISQTW